MAATSEDMTNRHRDFSARGVGTTALTLVLLAGCAAHSPPRADEAKVKQFAGRGYLTDDRYSIATTYAIWDSGGRSFEVALSVPTKPGPFPLLIYLPTLGENRSAGDAWRTAWARGGYAVVSIQPLAEDAVAWSSVRARAGDFTGLARERYSSKVMADRIEALGAALAELIRRHDRMEAPLERIDLSRVGVAGYDLGAYAAMVIAGESVRGATLPRLPMRISAVIALSPYADFSGASFGERYATIRGPVLSITSDSDADNLGLVGSPSVRRAPFEYMPGGDKYLLRLSDLSHSALAGGEIKPEGAAGGSAERTARSARSEDTGRGGRRRGSGNMGSSSIGESAGQGRTASLDRTAFSPTAQAIGVAVVQGVTTAFLDAYLKGDPIAREWLDRDAQRWLKDRAEIKRK